MKWYEDKEYWEMCRKAEEIQRVRNGIWIKGDRILNLKLEKVWLYTHLNSASSKLLWLPSQEDLQEMVKDLPNAILPWTLIRTFFKWTLEIYTHDFGDTSMTKLWLAFVMHELYQKRWNPETKKWEKTEE